MSRLLLIGVCGGPGFAPPAFAHAHLVRAVPAVGGTVSAAPAQLQVTFSEAVEPAFSSIEVRDAGGQRVDDGALHPAADDKRGLAIGLKPLAGGTYSVLWHATSVDTHKTDGRFSFTVKP